MIRTLPDTDGLIAPSDFDTVSRLLRAMSGIHLVPSKRAMVSARLAKRLKSTGLRDIRDYCAFLERPEGAGERAEFVSVLTTNMTRFQREAHHFEFLRRQVLPGLVALARDGGRVRLWSAGCSSGQEPYELAFHILDLCPDAPRLDLRVLASDIDNAVLSTARAGRYPESSVAQLKHDHAKRYFRPAPDSPDLVEVTEPARALIRVRQLNLMDDWPFTGLFDVIMCRNVAIYFDDPTQVSLWQRFAQQLRQGGLLLIGHSEHIAPGVVPDAEPAGPGIFRIGAPAEGKARFAAKPKHQAGDVSWA